MASINVLYDVVLSTSHIAEYFVFINTSMYLIISLTIVVAPNSSANVFTAWASGLARCSKCWSNWSSLSRQPTTVTNTLCSLESTAYNSHKHTVFTWVDSLQQSQTHCVHLSRQPTTVTNTLCSLESTAYNSHKHTVFTWVNNLQVTNTLCSLESTAYNSHKHTVFTWVDSPQQSQTHCVHLSRQPTTVTNTLCSYESTAYNSHKHTVFT